MMARETKSVARKPTRPGGVFVCLCVFGVGAAASSSPAAPQTLYPQKDGTLVDGSVFGAFDGTADDADWYFNESSYEGSITLSTAPSSSGVEHRVVWEYDLSGVAIGPPVQAILHFTLRGAPVYPRPDVNVHVYSYPADMLESMSDFDAGPAFLQGTVTVAPYQAPTAFTVDLSGVAGIALADGTDMIAVRFQVDPQTQEPANQAFIDALDSDPATKPYLVIDQAPAVPGDLDGDGDVDLADYAALAGCMSGPNVPVDAGCLACDFDQDTDVDLADFQLFQTYFDSL